MIELDVIQHLSDGLTVPVYAERPEIPEDSYVLIELTSLSERNHIYSAMIALQCYAPSLLKAAALCGEVCKCMDDITGRPNISHAKLNSAYNFTNTATKEYRYQAVFDLVFMEGE